MTGSTRLVYQNGNILYADDLNAIANPTVDGQDYIGHGPKVIDTYLSDDPTQIKGNFYGFYNRLLVTVSSGLTLSYLPGVLLLSNGTLVSIAPGTINVPDATTSYVYVANTGVITSATVLPNECFPLALVVTVGGYVSTLTDLRNKIIDRITTATIPVTQQIPTGTGTEFWGTVLPSGWLWADGSSYLITQYPALFAAIGYIHGGSGSNFNVPDKRGRVSVGAGQGNGLTNRIIGSTFGTETTTLTVSQMPSHLHGLNDTGHAHGIADPGHVHNLYDPGHLHSLYPFRQYAQGGGAAGDGAELTTYPGGSNIHPNVQASVTGLTMYANGTSISIYPNGTGISMNNQGGDGAHDNTQPSLVANYIIKT